MDNSRPNNGNQITILGFSGQQTVTMGELKRLILERKVKRHTKCQIGAQMGYAQDIKGLEPYFQRAEGPSIISQAPSADAEPERRARKTRKQKVAKPARNIPGSVVMLICVAIIFGSVVTFRYVEQSRKAKAEAVKLQFRQELVDSVMYSYDNPEEGMSFSQTINGLIIQCRAKRDATMNVKKEMEARRNHLRRVYATAVRFEQAEKEGKEYFTGSNGLQYDTTRDGLELAVTDVIVGGN